MNANGELVKSFETSKTGKHKLVKHGNYFQTTDIYILTITKTNS
jgi:hypothetical protein